MNTNLTEIVFVIDESGSMFSLTSDTIGGFNSLVEEQKHAAGEAKISLVLFNDSHRTVYDSVDVAVVPTLDHYTYRPGGCTALLDALGDTINKVGVRLASTPENERPGKVMFVIITDGYENASREFTKQKVRDMIEHQKTKYSWQFMFLGANMDAVSEAATYGITRDCAATYAATNIGTEALYNAVSKSVCDYRATGSISSDWKNDLGTVDDYCLTAADSKY